MSKGKGICLQYASRCTKQIKLMKYIKYPLRARYRGISGCRKSHLVLDLIKKKKKPTNKKTSIPTTPSISVHQSMFWWINKYHDKGWMINNDNFWLINAKYKLFQQTENSPLIVALLFVDDIIADESPDKQKKPLLES